MKKDASTAYIGAIVTTVTATVATVTAATTAAATTNIGATAR